MMRALLLICMILFPLSVHATTLEETLHDLQQTMGNVRTLRSEFTQEKRLAMFDDVLESKGILSFFAPDKLRWEYTSPASAGFIINGTNGRSWNEMVHSEQSFRVKDNVEMRMLSEQVMGWTAFDLHTLSKGYSFQLDSEKPLVLTLIPKSKRLANFLARMTVTFSDRQDAISSLKFIEADGDVTTYHFYNTQRNTALDESVFMP